MGLPKEDDDQVETPSHSRLTTTQIHDGWPGVETRGLKTGARFSRIALTIHR